jgi:hypothetical protein
MVLILRSVLNSGGLATRPMAMKAFGSMVYTKNAGALGMLVRRPLLPTSAGFSATTAGHSNENKAAAAATTKHYFSTAAVIRGKVSDGVSSPMETIQQQIPGSVTKRLRILDVSTVQKIQEELRSVDVNSDGAYVSIIISPYYCCFVARSPSIRFSYSHRRFFSTTTIIGSTRKN